MLQEFVLKSSFVVKVTTFDGTVVFTGIFIFVPRISLIDSTHRYSYVMKVKPLFTFTSMFVILLLYESLIYMAGNMR